MTADVETRTRLRCDEPGCKATYPTEKPLYAGHVFTRKMAADIGWRYDVLRGDFCPEHPSDAGVNADQSGSYEHPEVTP